MEHAIKLLYSLLAIMVFCVAITLLYQESKDTNSLLELQKRIVSRDTEQMLYSSGKESMAAESISYAEVIGQLLGELDFDIKIDTLYITAENYDPAMLDLSVVAVTAYKKSYVLNPDGSIQYIEYNSV